jgi:multidrug resistance efflux pump
VARANYTLAQAGLGNESTLNAEASVAGAQQALDQAQTGPTESDIGAAGLQVSQAELTLEQAGFNLELAQQDLDKALLYAPWRGEILTVDSALGAIVGAGMPIVTLMDTAELQFHTSNLSERDLAYIGPGQAAEVVLKSYPSEAIGGVVAYVVPQASGGIGDAATFTVVIDLDQTQLALKPGMTGRVDIERGE